MVQFIYVTSDMYDVQHIGLNSIISYLREHGYHCQYTVINSNLSPESQVKHIHIDTRYLGFTLYATNAAYVYEFAKIIKQKRKDITIFCGSQFVTSAPELILKDCEAIDYLTLGPGENTTYQLIQNLKENISVETIPNVYSRKIQNKFINIQDEIYWKVAEDHIIEHCIRKNNRFIRISSSRGCCANCSFCFANYYGHRWQGMKVQDIYDNIIYLSTKYKIYDFYFNDQSLEDPGELGKKRLEQLCRLIISSGLRLSLRGYIRAESFHEEDIPLIQLMQKAGFTEVCIGVEANNPHDLEIYNKNADIDDNVRSYDLFTKNGIQINLGFILFNPYSTENSVKENYKFLRKINSHMLEHYISKLDIYFQSSIYFTVKEAGLLKPTYNYLATYEYNFQNENIQNINQWLDTNLRTDTFWEWDSHFRYLGRTITALRRLYPVSMEKYWNIYSEIINERYKAITIFFDYLYSHIGNFDRNYADVLKQTLEQKMMELDWKISKLKLQIVHNKHFNTYFWGEGVLEYE